MSSSGLEAIDRSMHKTYAWIGDLALELGIEASLVLEACGRVLRRRVSDGEVPDVLDNLPDELRASPSG